jgi:cytoskeletal protein CcmA (bactofilin family)
MGSYKEGNEMAKTEEVKPLNLTVFGEETDFSGELSFTDNLVITGKFSGTIKAGGNLEIAKTAVCSVDTLESDSVIIAGAVTGNITAPGRVEMQKGCKITGDVMTGRLRIAEDVDFHGQVTMIDRNREISQDIFELSPEEYKKLLLDMMEETKDMEETEDMENTNMENMNE